MSEQWAETLPQVPWDKQAGDSGLWAKMLEGFSEEVITDLGFEG